MMTQTWKVATVLSPKVALLPFCCFLLPPPAKWVFPQEKPFKRLLWITKVHFFKYKSTFDLQHWSVKGPNWKRTFVERQRGPVLIPEEQSCRGPTGEPPELPWSLPARSLHPPWYQCISLVSSTTYQPQYFQFLFFLFRAPHPRSRTRWVHRSATWWVGQLETGLASGATFLKTSQKS